MTSDVVLVVDVGTTGLRTAVVDSDGVIVAVDHRPCPPDSPIPGMVEFDAVHMARLVLESAHSVLEHAGSPVVAGVGIATQRASTILWDRATGQPLASALGWQDLRTVGACLTLKAEHGLAFAPNQSATKLAWLLENTAAGRDPAELCFGTVDSWIAWTLSGGSVHATDHTNAAVTGLYSIDDADWNPSVCDLLGIDQVLLPRIVDSSALVGAATALPGGPPIAAIVGDQQASLVGQGCITPGTAKVTFGTGAMLDVCSGASTPAAGTRSTQGTFPIVAWSADGRMTYGTEAIMLSAGANVEWLCELGIIDAPADSHAVASSVSSTDGVVFVPALVGLGTPHWDYGARGSLFGLTRGTERGHVVRSVMEGIAHRGADMVEAAELDTGLTIPALRIDGGMSRNPTFVQALADATLRPVEVSPVVEATTLGAAFHAGVAVGVWPDLEHAVSTWSPSARVEPETPLDRDVWHQAIKRSRAWIPELSALDF